MSIPKPANREPILSAKRVAEALSAGGLRITARYVRDHIPPSVRFSPRKKGYYQSDVDRWVERHRPSR